MIPDRDQRLQDNEDEARRIKEELVLLREAILRHENALNALAIERTNLESAPGEEQIEISPELQESLRSLKIVTSRRIWPKMVIGALALAGILLGLSGLGIFHNDGSTSVAQRAIPIPSHVAAPMPSTGNQVPTVTLPSIPGSAQANSTSPKVNEVPAEMLMNILPGTTYTTEITYSTNRSVISVVEVRDTPQIALHINQASQTAFIPLRTSFRIDTEGMDMQHYKMVVLARSKQHDLEIRSEPRQLRFESKILGVSSSQ